LPLIVDVRMLLATEPELVVVALPLIVDVRMPPAPTEPELVVVALPLIVVARMLGTLPELVQVMSLPEVTHCASVGEMPPARLPATSAAKIRTVEGCKVLRAPAAANLPKIAIRVLTISKMQKSRHSPQLFVTC
jgi:hypothetical protein